MLSFLLKLRTRAQIRFRFSEAHTMLVWAVIVGVAGAFATSAFREGIDELQWLFGGANSNFVEIATRLPWPVRVALPTAGGLIARCRSSGQANADYMEAVTIGDGVVPVWQSMWRSISSLFTIASGESIGREGSMAQLASLIGRWVHFDPPRLRLLVACGAAVGITSAYNAPIAGAFFVSELVLDSMAMESFGPIMVSSVVANITMREFAGYRPPYKIPVFPTVTGVEVLLFVVLGLLCGVLAPYFLRLLAASKQRFAKLPLPLPIRLGFGDLIVGVISIWFPEVWGNGYEIVNSILHHSWTWEALAAVLFFKIVATAATAGSGAVGGIFTPTLFVGAVVGCLFGLAAHTIWPHSTSAPFAYAMVGMGAFLAAATHAPLMAILMIFEMTLSYQVMLPLMLSCVVAFSLRGRRRRRQCTRLRCAATAMKKSACGVTQMRELVKPADTVVPLDADVKTMTRVFLEYPVKYLYVVDSDGQFRGMVALKDITSDLHEEHDTEVKTAEDYLQAHFDVLTPDMSLGEALQHFLAFQGERLPVINCPTRPVLLGVVYKTSLLDA